jgi:anti-anti-sigma regulatory factor
VSVDRFDQGRGAAMRSNSWITGAGAEPSVRDLPVSTTPGSDRPPGDRPWRVSSPTGRSRGDHLCWPFRRRDELLAAARAYVAEGLSRQERVAYVSGVDPAGSLPDLIGIPGLAEHVERGRLQVVPGDRTHGADAGEAADLSVLATLTEEALAAGYRGLRMFADETVRVHDPARRMRQVSYEHQLDRFCCTHPLAALCAYDAAALGNSAVAELVCVHALAHGDLSPFHLRAARGADAALAGSIDVFCVDQLEQALRRTGVARAGGIVAIDAADLEFIDVRGLLTLDRHAVSTGATIVLRSAPPVVTRVLELVDMVAVRVEGRR